MSQLDKSETIALRLANLEVLINAVLYNPSAALRLIESSSSGMGRVFFDKWFAAINVDERLPRVHDKKLSILALCSLLEMAPDAIPEALKDGWPGIVAGILKIFKDFPRAMEGTYNRHVDLFFLTDTFVARKVLEDALQEDSDDEDIEEERLLNLDGGDGKSVSGSLSGNSDLSLT